MKTVRARLKQALDLTGAAVNELAQRVEYLSGDPEVKLIYERLHQAAQALMAAKILGENYAGRGNQVPVPGMVPPASQAGSEISGIAMGGISDAPTL